VSTWSALGWLPSAVATIGALPVAQLAPVPDTPPDWSATAALVAVAVALASVGILGYSRRDLVS
jgi:putative exporter of polyketide antibiotics